MTSLINALIGFAGGLLGALLIVLYYNHVSNRQKRALVLVFAQEFMLLFERCTIYYEQMLKKTISFSTLFQIGDSTTVTKLAEETTNTSILETIGNLKAEFFQVIRGADKASAATDTLSQSKAIAFFMGSLQSEDNSLDRLGYKAKKDGICEILDYLGKLNSRWDLRLLAYPFSNLREQRKGLNAFIEKSRKKLATLETQLEKLRLEEKGIRIKEGIQFELGERE